MLVVHEEQLPVCYVDWAQWRETRTETALGLPADLVVVRCFCAFCWGAGRIVEDARNGEGLIPVTCERCLGEGTVMSPGT